MRNTVSVTRFGSTAYLFKGLKEGVRVGGMESTLSAPGFRFATQIAKSRGYRVVVSHKFRGSRSEHTFGVELRKDGRRVSANVPKQDSLCDEEFDKRALGYIADNGKKIYGELEKAFGAAALVQ